jgi:hypothetical protein
MVACHISGRDSLQPLLSPVFLRIETMLTKKRDETYIKHLLALVVVS